MFRSKPDEVEWRTQRIIRSAHHLADTRYDSYTLYPTGDRDHRAREFYAGLRKVWETGGWTTVLDELFYINRQRIVLAKKSHALQGDVEDLLTQGRSKHITVVSGLQRPLGVTRFAISQSRHVIAFYMEKRDAKELGLATTSRLEDAVQDLDEYEFVWFHRPRRLWVGTLNLKAGVLEGRYL